MKFKFITQDYQRDAVNNICKVFHGQPYCDMVKYTRDLGIRGKKYDNRSKYQTDESQIDMYDYDKSAYEENDDGFENAKILLDEHDIFENIREIQRANNYKVSDELIRGLGKCSLDIEMETGTGKTYVYIKSIFELNEKYGWSKFIIVVPSIAIREGVKKSFEMMEDHFMDQYHKKARYFIYNSKRLSELDSFASSSDIQVMIINAQAFNARGADARRIDMVLDEFQSRRPIDVVAKTRPILIIDEPQKLGGEATQTSLKKFNPLFNMNFSATHKKQHNLVYCLDALDAYNKSLVKKIQVKGFEIKNLRGTDKYVYLQDIIRSENKPPMAKIEFEVKYKTSIKKETRVLGVKDDLYKLSNNMEQYRNNFIISDIDAYNNVITFLNGTTLHVGELIGDASESNLRRIQIRETIISHLEKEEFLFNKGVKCLSLFFIDEVSKYRDYSRADEMGEYARVFEEEYTSIINNYLNQYETPYIKYLKSISVNDTHKGYFSIDRKTGHAINSKDNKETGSDDISAYELILKNKERLLSFEEPTRFIFSHSALREGWDNPNIFQICALKPGGDSAVAKRQEVGRGLRISINKIGDRMDLNYCKDRSSFLNMNILTVIAADSYRDFVADIQKDIKSNLADRPTTASINYFIGKQISDGTEHIIIDQAMASRIVFGYLEPNGYIDSSYKLTSSYFDDKANGAFKEMPEILSPYAASIHELIQGIFDEKILDSMITNERTPVMRDNPLNENFKKKEFQELWNRINHKYAYSVSFDSEELIRKAIQNIDDNLYVTSLKYIVTTGEQNNNIYEEMLNNESSFNTIKTRSETLTASNSNKVPYDLIGEIKKNTNLTRKTITRILQGIKSDVFAMFRTNPEEFLSKVARLINEQKATMIVDHITYNVTDGKYDNDIFTANQIKTDLDRVFKANKAIQNYIITDGLAKNSVEKKFAEDLDVASEVCVYAKLPKAFHIPTPVGNYAPDWAIAFHDNMGIKHIYFVAETKGSMDSLELSGIEKAKTDCASKLFNTFNLAKDVRYLVVNKYEELYNIVSSSK